MEAVGCPTIVIHERWKRPAEADGEWTKLKLKQMLKCRLRIARITQIFVKVLRTSECASCLV